MIGRDLGRYKIVDILGSGRMSAVYKGVDEVNRRQVAIKILPPEWEPSSFDIWGRLRGIFGTP